MMPFMYAVVENSFGIICACLATYRPIFLWVLGTAPSNVKSWLSSNSSGGPGNRASAFIKRGSSLFPGHARRPSHQELMQVTPPMPSVPEMSEHDSLMYAAGNSPNLRSLEVPEETAKRPGSRINRHWADGAVTRAMRDDDDDLELGSTTYCQGPK